jgi:prolyl-tRNA synthetase
MKEPAERTDLASAVEGDPAPNGDGKLIEVKGIEVGHIFKLGNKYTKAFSVSVLDEKGKSVIPTMGCYGIGVNRTLAAVIEQNSSESGIVWPLSAAPFEMVLVSIAKKPEDIEKIEKVYKSLVDAGCDILWDDRDERPGVKFSDADLIGFPIRITVGKTFIENGSVEVQIQGESDKRTLTGSLSEITDTITELRAVLKKSLDEQAALALQKN